MQGQGRDSPHPARAAGSDERYLVSRGDTIFDLIRDNPHCFRCVKVSTGWIASEAA